MAEWNSERIQRELVEKCSPPRPFPYRWAVTVDEREGDRFALVHLSTWAGRAGEAKLFQAGHELMLDMNPADRAELGVARATDEEVEFIVRRLAKGLLRSIGEVHPLVDAIDALDRARQPTDQDDDALMDRAEENLVASLEVQAVQEGPGDHRVHAHALIRAIDERRHLRRTAAQVIALSGGGSRSGRLMSAEVADPSKNRPGGA